MKRKRKIIIWLLMISLVFSMTESAVVYAEEKVEEPITEYYGPRVRPAGWCRNRRASNRNS